MERREPWGFCTAIAKAHRDKSAKVISLRKPQEKTRKLAVKAEEDTSHENHRDSHNPRSHQPSRGDGRTEADGAATGRDHRLRESLREYYTGSKSVNNPGDSEGQAGVEALRVALNC
jgi:hypothetical protein